MKKTIVLPRTIATLRICRENGIVSRATENGINLDAGSARVFRLRWSSSSELDSNYAWRKRCEISKGADASRTQNAPEFTPFGGQRVCDGLASKRSRLSCSFA